MSFIPRNSAAAFAIAAAGFFVALPAAAAAPYCGCLTTVENERFCDVLSVQDEPSCNNACEEVADGQNASDHSVLFDADADSQRGRDLSAQCASMEQSIPDEPIATEQAAPPRPFVTPDLSFDIPGLVFSPVLEKNGNLEVNFIADYVTAAYRVLLGVSVTIAIVMVMIGGFQYVISPASGDVKAAKKRITDAVVGLVLLLSVYVILFTINPQLTLFQSLAVRQLPRIDVPESEEEFVNGSLASDFRKFNVAPITDRSNFGVAAEFTDAMTLVAADLEAAGFGATVASTLRTFDEQKALILTNCQNPPGSASCNPKPGFPTACPLRNFDPRTCPHTTGRAMDIWATEDGEFCVGKPGQLTQDCQKDLAACRANPCQAALIAAMRKQGFCVLASEPWHFEKPKMSGSCN